MSQAKRQRMTHWRIFKVTGGVWAGRWLAQLYSRADGFRYEVADFESHQEALDHVRKHYERSLT